MSYNVSGRWNFRQGGLKPAQYQSGGATSYQQQGLMINPDQPRNYYDDTYYQPPVYDGSTEGRMGWWITPDGARHSDEADAVEHINSGKMDSYNPDAASSYMPSDDTMADISAGEAVDRVTQFPTNNNPLVDNDRNNVPDYIQVNPVSPPSPNSGGGGSSGGGSGGSGGGGGGGSNSPFATKEEEIAFQDWANKEGHDTKGYGWGSASQGIFDEYGEEFFVARANAGGDPLRVNTSTAMNNSPDAGKENPLLTNRGLRAALGQGLGNSGGRTSSGEEAEEVLTTPPVEGTPDSVNTDGLSKEEKRMLNRLYKDVPSLAFGAGLAQLAPALYATLHKEKAQDLMGAPGRLSSPDLDRVSFNNERMSNASDNRALQRFIETSGGGPANIINKMASYRRKQTGDMQIAAAEAKANIQIGNTEAQMKLQTDAKNVANSMQVDSINTQLKEQQRIAAENQKMMGLDRMAQGAAGLAGDVLSYKAEQDLARSTGDMGIYERARLRNMLVGKVNHRTGKPYTNAEIAQVFNIAIETPVAIEESPKENQDT